MPLAANFNISEYKFQTTANLYRRCNNHTLYIAHPPIPPPPFVPAPTPLLLHAPSSSTSPSLKIPSTGSSHSGTTTDRKRISIASKTILRNMHRRPSSLSTPMTVGLGEEMGGVVRHLRVAGKGGREGGFVKQDWRRVRWQKSARWTPSAATCLRYELRIEVSCMNV